MKLNIPQSCWSIRRSAFVPGAAIGGDAIPCFTERSLEARGIIVIDVAAPVYEYGLADRSAHAPAIGMK